MCQKQKVPETEKVSVGEEKCISQSKNMSSKLLSRILFLLRDIQNKINLILRADSLGVKTFEKVLTSKLLEIVTIQEVTFADKLSCLLYTSPSPRD